MKGTTRDGGDAAPRADAFQQTDAASLADLLSPLDGASPPDATPPFDSASPPDATPLSDGAALPDTYPSPDSVLPPDAIPPFDAISPPDTPSPADTMSPLDSAPADLAPPLDSAPPPADAGPLNPIYQPNRFVSASATGSGDGSQADPWTLEQAFAQAVAGDQVQVAPGMYEVPHVNTNRLPQFSPQNAGTAQQRIVFFAQHPAVYQSSTAAMSRIHLDGGTGPVIGSNAYVTFDGFDFKQRGAHQYTSEGSVIGLWAQSVGTRILRCLFDAEGEGPTGNENWGAIFIQEGRDIEIADNIFRNFAVAGSGNATVIMLYDSTDYAIHHNTFENINCPFFPKGVHAGQPDLVPASFHHNMIRQANYGWQLGGVSQDTTNPGSFLDLYQNIVHGGVFFALRAYNATSPRRFRVVNNTFVVDGGDEAVYYGAGGPEPGNSVYEGAVSRNNIIVSTSNPKYYQTYAATTLGELQRWSHDNNLYSGITEFFNGGTSFSQWQAAGFDPNGASANPLFTDQAGGDLTLQPGSPARDLGVDVLNLRGAGTSAPINAGAYILPDQSDRIGVRPGP